MIFAIRTGNFYLLEIIKMDEWLKRHTYIVCGTLTRAKVRMQNDFYEMPQFQNVPDIWKVYKSRLQIVGPIIYQYTSVYQVLHYFDRVDNVDLFELDTTCSEIREDELEEAIHVLYQARMKTDRDKQRVQWLKEHDWGL